MIGGISPSTLTVPGRNNIPDETTGGPSGVRRPLPGGDLPAGVVVLPRQPGLLQAGARHVPQNPPGMRGQVCLLLPPRETAPRAQGTCPGPVARLSLVPR